jgi:hypothetical protein
MNQIGKMTQYKIALKESEEIVFEEYPARLTTNRLLVYSKKAKQNSPIHDFNIRELYSCQIVNGGELSRMFNGLATLLAGAFVWSVEILFHYLIPIPEILDLLMFIIGGGAFMYGLWQIVKSMTRKKPHTMVVFEDPIKGGEIILTYPGIDNQDAELLVKKFDGLSRKY